MCIYGYKYINIIFIFTLHNTSPSLTHCTLNHLCSRNPQLYLLMKHQSDLLLPSQHPLQAPLLFSPHSQICDTHKPLFDQLFRFRSPDTPHLGELRDSCHPGVLLEVLQLEQAAGAENLLYLV